MLAKKRRICLTDRCVCWIKEWYGNLIHLDQMKHLPQQSRVHFETRFVKAISHDSKNVLNECKQILLIKALGNVWCLCYVVQ